MVSRKTLLTGSLRASGSLEVKAYLTAAGVMLVWYIYSAFLAGQPRYGFDQLDWLGPVTAAGLIAAAVLVLALVSRRDREGSMDSGPLPYRKLLLPAFLSAAAASITFWFLRTGFINDDGLANMLALQAGMRIIRHDEMLATVMITRLWESGIAGVRPEDTIALYSVCWGFVYVFISVLIGGRLTGRRWPLFTVLCLSGGFVQLFAGDVEFYAMVAAMLALFILLVLEHTRGNISLVFPGLALLLAVFSHLLAGWVIPAFLYLMYRSIRSGKAGDVLLTAGTVIITAFLLFILVSSTGLPVHSITGSHAMGSADMSTLDMLAVPSVHYHAGVMNVLFLVFPFWGFFALLVFFRRTGKDPFNMVLMISTAMLLLLALMWNLGLGPYFDWNLVSSVGVPASVLLWGNLLRGRWVSGMKTAVVAVFLAGALHSWTWITGNHFEFSMMPREHVQEFPLPTGERACVIPIELQPVLESAADGR